MFSSLKVTSIQSGKSDDTCRQITRYLSKQLGISAEFVDSIPWEERKKQLLDTEQIHLGWICGIYYVQKVDSFPSYLELVAAPVMQHLRYCQQPIYFSDVIVRSDRPYYSFADLRGKSWAYNHRNSHSGYHVVCYHLAQLGETQGYFSKAIETGTHLQSIERVFDGYIDAAAIDSMVLDFELQTRPQLQSKLRIIETLGPSPIPPWVITINVPSVLREEIRRVFWQMHETVEGRAILGQEGMMKMVRVEDSSYNLTRKMAQRGDRVIL